MAGTPPCRWTLARAACFAGAMTRSDTARDASVLAPFSYTQLLTSGLLGVAVFGHVPDGGTLLGAAVIAASGLYMAHRERVRARGG